MAKRFNRRWGEPVEPRARIVENVRAQIERESVTGKKIMLCFTCDPYPNCYDSTATREVIKAIKESGNFVQILTKGGKMARRDFDLLDEGDSFGVTWSGADDIDEPGAASHAMRYENICVAKLEYGLHTWMSCEPVLNEASIYSAIESFSQVDLFRIGKLNYAPSDIDWGKFGWNCVRLCHDYGRDYYIKEDLREYMEEMNRDENAE
jgi:DNA repair photolyase